VIKSFVGVWEASIATLTLAAGFLFITISGPQPNPLNAFISQIIFICGFFLIYLAICRFTDQTLSKIIIFGLLPVSFISMILSVIAFSSISVFKQIALLTGFVLFISSATKLLLSDHREYKLSAIVTAITLFIYGFILLGQLIAGFFSIEQVLPVRSTSEIVASMAMFIASYLWSGGFVLMISQRLQGELNELAMNDALTRVRNRRAMDQLLSFEIQRAQKEVKDFSIILCDIDHFKRINDSFGHEIGDKVLQWFAFTLQNNLRIQDVVARWGGEEFLILLPVTTIDEATQIAERLRSIVASSEVDILEETIRITFSAGISSSISIRDVKGLCRVADQALYIAKETRNRIVTQSMIPSDEAI